MKYHVTNTNNPIDFPNMTKYVHIIQVHPVELGEPNLHKVKFEREFDTKNEAMGYVLGYNDAMRDSPFEVEAVYLGRVNDATGELE